jgi:hypothetical protein
MNRRDVLIMGAASSLPGQVRADAEEMSVGGDWRYVADTVMGGVSRGRMTRERVMGRMAARLTGTVSTENDGGFIQITTDLAGGGAFDASAWTGVALDVTGNAETYELRLRTSDLDRPWQSYRMAFRPSEGWGTLRVPFAGFEANRTRAPFDAQRLTRIGVLAIGREFEADIAVDALRLWR